MVKSNGNGQGSITERKGKNGKIVSYQAQATVPGTRLSKSFKTKREAQAWIARMTVASMEGRVSVGGNVLFTKYLTDWLGRQEDKLKPSAFSSYSLNVRRICSRVGKTSLNGLTPRHVQHLYDDLRNSGLAPQTVRQVHATLHKALQDAMEMDMIPRNVSNVAKLPRVASKEPTWYSETQLNALFSLTVEDRFHALWLVLGTTGMRLGEALGLKWGDVDLQGKTIHVRRALQRKRDGGGLIFVEPKTKQSKRVIPLTGEAVAALQAHRERLLFEARQAGNLWQDQDLVFPSEVGTPLEQSRVHLHWTAATRLAGIPRYRIHDLRHTCASHLVAGGMSVHDVASVLGHANAALVLTRYGHARPNAGRIAAETMEAVLAKAKDR